MKTLLIYLLGLAFIAWGIGALTQSMATLTHPQAMACDSCHLARQALNAENAKMLLAGQEQLCQSCHQNAVVASHPTGIKPSMDLPASLPLDWKGDVTCSTCHQIHGSEPGLSRVEPSGREFCLMCHEQGFFDEMKDQGISIMLSGHLDPRAPLNGQIDAFSIQCMSCHESRSDELAVSMNGNIIRHIGGRGNHPVGVPYQRGVDFGGYRSIAEVPQAISLPNGKVSCISCHEAYSETHGRLVMDNSGSRLCYGCHDL